MAYRRLGKRILRWSGRIIFVVLLVYLLVFFAAMAIINSPAMQRKLTPYAADMLAGILDTRVEVGRVYLRPFDIVELQDVVLYDQADSLLAKTRKTRVSLMNFVLFQLLDADAEVISLQARRVEVQGLEANIYRRADSTFNFAFLSKPDTTPKKGKPLHLLLEDVQLSDARFRYTDYTKPDSVRRWDKRHMNFARFEVYDLSLRTRFELTPEQKLLVRLKQLKLRERSSNFKLKNLAVDFSAYLKAPDASLTGLAEDFHPDSLQLRAENLQLLTPRSDVSADLRLPSTHLGNIGDIDRLQLISAFRPSEFHFATLQTFVANPLPLAGEIRFKGFIDGNLEELRGRDFSAGIADSTLLSMDFNLEHFTKPESLKMDFKFRQSRIAFAEVQRTVKPFPTIQPINRLYWAELEGAYKGTLNSLETDISLFTPHGDAEVDVEMRNFADPEQVSYKGEILTRNLNLDTILRQPIAQRLNIQANLDGIGFTFEKMELKASYRLDTSVIQSYFIDSSYGKVNIREKKLDGDLEMIDQEGNFSGRVVYNLAGPSPNYQAFGDVENLQLHHYNLTEDTTTLTAIFNIDLTGDSLDVMEGYARAFSVDFKPAKQQQPISLDNTVLRIKTNGPDEKSFRLSSDIANLELIGRFRYQAAIEHLTSFGKEIELFFRNDTSLINPYYSKKRAAKDSILEKPPASFDLFFSAKPYIDSVSKFFKLPLKHLNPGASVTGHFEFGRDEYVELILGIDSINVQEIGVAGLNGNVEFTKPNFQNLIVGSGAIKSERVQLSEGFALTKVYFHEYIRNHELEYHLRFYQDTTANNFHFKGLFTLEEDNQLRNLFFTDSTYFVLNDSTWRISPNNEILYGFDNTLLIKNLTLSSDYQYIRVQSNIQQGKDGGEGRSPLEIDFRDVDLDVAERLTNSPVDYDGIVNAKVKLLNIFQTPVAELNGRVNSFAYAGTALGDVLIDSKWSNLTQKLALELDLYNHPDTILAITGYYTPSDTVNPLDFKLKSNNLPIALAEPFYKDYLYNVSGRLDIAKVYIYGKLTSPTIAGKVFLDRVNIGVNDLQREFYINNTIQFETDTIKLKRLKIYDQPPNNDFRGPARKKMYITGNIIHNGFTQFQLDLGYEVPANENFVVMNTTRKHNDTFYGKVVLGGGNGTIKGTFDDLKVDAAVTTGPGTNVSIPIEDYTESARPDYVFFVSDTADTLVREDVFQSSGVDLRLAVNAENDAQINIIFDEQAGDIIKAQGNGKILMEITPEGEFNMSGGYTISDGDYVFTFQNVINKKFNIEEGSTIQWDGDAYNAQMDITAYYERDVNLATLDSTLSGVRPVQVVMDMTGSLEAPEIDFSINIPNINQDQGYKIVSKLAYIENDASEFNRQVFSLLLFGQFAPTGSFIGGGGGGVTSSVSEFLSGQLNSLISQSLRTDNIDINIETAQDVVNLGLRLSLLNDRLIIERNGSVVSGGNQDMSLGNISIQLKLLPPRGKKGPQTGVLAIEVFNRENVTSNAVVASDRGVGIFFKREFDTLAELFRRRKFRSRYDAPARAE